MVEICGCSLNVACLEEKVGGEHHVDKRKMTRSELRSWGMYLLGG